jgi:hypothetical protein
MVGLVRHAALPIEARATGKRCWAGAVSRRLAAIIAAEVRGYSWTKKERSRVSEACATI